MAMASYSEIRLFALEGKVERLIRRLEALEALAAAAEQRMQRITESPGGNANPGILYALTPAGGIGGRSGGTCPSASCELYFKDGTGLLSDTGGASPVFNLSPTAVAAGKYIAVSQDSNGDLTTLVESCP